MWIYGFRLYRWFVKNKNSKNQNRLYQLYLQDLKNNPNSGLFGTGAFAHPDQERKSLIRWQNSLGRSLIKWWTGKLWQWDWVNNSSGQGVDPFTGKPERSIFGGITKYDKEFIKHNLFTPSMGFKNGGQVIGPGTGTSDSIAARVSNKEYIIRASAVKQYGTGLLDSINNQTFSIPQVSNIPTSSMNNSNSEFAFFSWKKRSL